MASSKKSYNSKISFYNTIPDDLNAQSFVSSEFLENSNNVFYTFEKISGKEFIITYENEKILIYSENSTDEIVHHFNQTLVKPFSRLVQMFNKVNLALYGEFVTSKNSKTNYENQNIIYFYDMYINDNWIYCDDFVEIFTKVGLPIPPILRKGIPSENYINFLSEGIAKNSYIEGNSEIYGFYIKSNDKIRDHRKSSKGAFELINPKFKSKEAKTKNVKEHENIKKKVEELGFYTITDEIIEKWNQLLKKKKIQKRKDNFSSVLPLLVNDYLDTYEDEKYLLALEENLEAFEAEKMIKKYLPAVIIEKMFQGE